MDRYYDEHVMDPLTVQLEGCMKTFLHTGIRLLIKLLVDGSNMEMLADLLSVVVSNPVEQRQALLFVIKYYGLSINVF